jgi:pyrroloquinoline quinone (PQQ) biosynthesis protein C
MQNIKSINALVNGKNLLEDSAFNQIKMTRISSQKWTIISQEYYAFSQEFPKILSTLADRIIDPFINKSLCDLIAVEEGRNGKPRHSDLFINFAKSINVSPSIVTLGPFFPETIDFLSWLKQTYSSASIAYALGAQFSFEILGDYIIQGFRQILEQYPELSDDNIEYFLIHSEAEPEHSILMEHCLKWSIKNEFQLNLSRSGAIHCKIYLEKFWHKIWEACL